MGVSYELELDEDRVKHWILEHRGHWHLLKVFFLMVCGGDEEVKMATNPSKKFYYGKEQKNGVVAGQGCGLEDIWFWFYCSKNKGYCIVFL